jgi:cytochrome c553
MPRVASSRKRESATPFHGVVPSFELNQHPATDLHRYCEQRSTRIMPRHIARLLLLLVVFAAVGYGAKRLFTVDSFYEYGHYRADSVAEIAADKPKYQGTALCQSCHAERFAEWSGGAHHRPEAGKIVKCEVCHGAAGERDDRGPFKTSATGAEHPNNLKLALPADTRKLCTLCHERITGRPAQQPQIVVADHAGTQQCTLCHNPHSPKLKSASPEIAQQGDAVIGQTKAAACVGCHAGAGDNGIGPRLAGQNQPYLIDAFRAYGTGARANAMMSAVVQTASEEDLTNIAAYFAGVKCAITPIADREPASATQAALAKCTACHGPNGVSSNRSWPNLAGLTKDYLVNALKAYKSGERKHPMMTPVAKDLSDTDAEDAAAYYAAADCR